MHIATENKLVHTKQKPVGDHIPTSNGRYNPDIDATLKNDVVTTSDLGRLLSHLTKRCTLTYYVDVSNISLE